jgi:hypothetical protein
MMERCFPALLALFAASAPVLAQTYKLESVSSAAPGLPSAYGSVMEARGYRVTGPAGPWCEIWFRNAVPVGAKPADPSVTIPLAQGTLVGVIRFAGAGADRRGQTIKAGLYTMRYSQYPVDGAHQGVAPQRDFLLLTPASSDPDPNATPDFAGLVKMSTAASGTPHPAVLSIEQPGGTTFPELTKEGERDWVLNVKLGELPLAIIVAGKYEG